MVFNFCAKRAGGEANSNNKFFCEFADNGDIAIRVVCENILPINEIEKLIDENVNPVISVVADFLAQSGYHFDIFKNLTDERVEMLDMIYKLSFPVRKTLQVSKKHGCLWKQIHQGGPTQL